MNVLCTAQPLILLIVFFGDPLLSRLKILLFCSHTNDGSEFWNPKCVTPLFFAVNVRHFINKKSDINGEKIASRRKIIVAHIVYIGCGWIINWVIDILLKNCVHYGVKKCCCSCQTNKEKNLKSFNNMRSIDLSKIYQACLKHVSLFYWDQTFGSWFSIYFSHSP